MKTLLPEFDGVAGAAFLLRIPARKSITLQHSEGIVTVRESGAYATVQLFFVPPDDALRTATWRVLQEALDTHAATHREPIATQRGEQEYLLWTRAVDGYRLNCADTFDMPWSMSVQMTVGSEAPAPAPVATPIPYHPSFRFYRLSQLTDDLFDAYRNAYLSLECLVSDESAKDPNESEVAWLKRVLGGSLFAGVPGGMDINQTVEDMYKLGRLPLFHAKTGAFYAPHGEERERVQQLLEQLTALLAALFRHNFGDRFAGGWGRMSQGAHDAQAREVFQFDEVVYRRESERESFLPKVEVISQPRRFGNLWGRLEVAKPINLPYIDEVEFLHDGQYWCGLEFPECVPMKNVAVVKFEFSLLLSTIPVRRNHPTRCKSMLSRFLMRRLGCICVGRTNGMQAIAFGGA